MTPTLLLPASTVARPSHTSEAVRQALMFTTIIIAASVFLQRFGFPAAGKPVSIVGPIGLAAAVLGLLRGALTFSVARLSAFLLLCLAVLVGMAYHQIAPNHYLLDASLTSVLQFLILTSFATLSFTYPVPEGVFFRRVNAILAVVAIAGILQFVVQFAGLQLFSFRGIVPDALLFEDSYNQQIPLGFGNLFKSNGFFMLEPSVFSQFMSVALIIEILGSKRVRHLVLFTAAMLLSMAGTGWLVLGTFVATVAVSMGRRGALVSVATLLMVAVVAIGASMLAPEAATAFQSRFDEISRQDTSGHLRFITPFWMMSDVLTEEPAAALVGVGAGVSERLTMPYDYNVNTPVKIAVEYGFPALLIYLVLLAAGRKTPTQRALTPPGIMLLLFAGGYQQLAPVLFPILLMMSCANLQPDPER